MSPARVDLCTATKKPVGPTMTTPTDSYLRDRVDILDTITAYFIAIDHREFERLEQVFATDAEANFDGKSVGPGLSSIIDFVAGRGKVDYPVDIVDIEWSATGIAPLPDALR